jgi:uncharacterized protein YndB with AHSA1/START domain
MMTDRIEKTIVLRAPRAEVWRAITTAEDFGAWFGARFTSAFKPATTVSGRITTPGYDHLLIDIMIERMDDQRLFSYRWHPHAVDAAVDYSKEPTTLVEFRLEDVPDGTRLTIVESGFDRLSADRRETAFRMNNDGWAQEVKNIERYVSDHRSSAAARH